MTPDRFEFRNFLLDVADRQLWRDGKRIEINDRYLDALRLLVTEQGRLVTKDRFLEEVWRGVPVTDEALTQCIKVLRRQLGDNVAAPLFIETVPKRGYRFIATVEPVGRRPTSGPKTEFPWRRFLRLGLGGTAGAATAGILGGLFYGFIAASDPLQAPAGAVSALLVLTSISLFVALLGGTSLSFAIAAASFAPARAWTIAAGALGGMLIGAVGKLLGLDAFTLLVGHSPGDITGPFEGVLLGGSIGIAASFAKRDEGYTSAIGAACSAAVAGGVAGILIVLLGGKLMAGSLDVLQHSFPTSHLRIDRIGALFGENGFGTVARTASAALEGAFFGACLIGGMAISARRRS